MQFLFTLCATLYLLLYAFEGAVRYALYDVGLDNAILLRDVLIGLPLGLLLVAQSFRFHVNPAFIAFAAIILLHGTIARFNLGSALPAIYGTKLLLNVLFGFIAARPLTMPSRRMLWLLGLVWAVSVTGVVLDKFVVEFPWVGLETHVGGLKVDVSRGWDIDDMFEKRAAGFSRSSISAAMLLPTLALIVAPRIRSFLVRFLMIALTAAAVALTTQKGSLFAICAVGLIVLLPGWSRYRLLCLATLALAAIDVALPVFSSGLLLSADSGGVFSFSSFAMRIVSTWPDAWNWVRQNDAFPFGVGLGGIGGAQRFYAANFFNPSDNLFVFLYANFGVLGLVYLFWTAFVGRGLPEQWQRSAVPPLAILAFNLGYGAALSMLEDQVSALFIGAAAGMLWQLHQSARNAVWSDPWRGAVGRVLRPVVPAWPTPVPNGVRAS
jgi:hypothetical protein